MESISTPEEIIQKIRELNNIEVDRNNTKYLNEYIKENSRLTNGLPLFVSETTGKSPRYNYYVYTFKRDCDCQAKVGICITKSKFSVVKSSTYTHNHRLDANFMGK